MWSDVIQSWLAWLRAGGTREQTLTLRRQQASRLAADMKGRGPWELGADDLAEWLAGHQWSRETMRSHRAMLRSLYGWAHAGGRISADPARLLRKVPPAVPTPRPADEDVIGAALSRADDRVALMLLLGSRHGLRRGEIAQVHTGDMTSAGGIVWLVVHGKGGKPRRVPVTGEAARLLRAAPAGWVFPGRRGPLTAAHVGKLMRRALGSATAHQLRHRFASVAYQRSGDIVAVSRLLGHASVATTQRYVATDDDVLLRVASGAA